MKNTDLTTYRVVTANGKQKDYSESDYIQKNLPGFLEKEYPGQYTVFKLETIPNTAPDAIDDGSEYLMSVPNPDGSMASKVYTGKELKDRDLMDGYFNKNFLGQYNMQKIRAYDDADIALRGDALEAKAWMDQNALDSFDAENKTFMDDYKQKQHSYDTGSRSYGSWDDPNFVKTADYVVTKKSNYNNLVKKRRELQHEYESNPIVQSAYKQAAKKAQASADLNLEKENAASGQDYNNYKNARKFDLDAAQLYSLPIRSLDDSIDKEFLKGMGKGMADTFGDRDFWTMGITEIARNVGVSKIFEDLKERGLDISEMSEQDFDNALTDSQKALLFSFLRYSEAAAQRSGSMPKGYSAGQTAAESLGFMTQFFITGGAGSAIAKGVGKAATKAVTKGTAKGLTKFLSRAYNGSIREIIEQSTTRSLVKDMTANGAKYLTKDMKPLISIASKTAGGLYEYGVKPLARSVARTPFMMSTYVAASEDLLQRAQSPEEIGSIGSAFLQSVWNSLPDQIIENWSEDMGPGIEALGGSVKKGIGKALGSTVGKINVGEITLGQWGKWVADSYSNKVLLQAGFNGLVGEMAEEWVGNAARVAVGIMDKEDFKEFADPRQQLEMAISFAPMSLLGLGSSSVAAVKQAKEYRASVEEMRGVLNRAGMTKEEIANILDTTHSKQEIADALTPVLNKIIANASTENGQQTSIDDYKATLRFAQNIAASEVMDAAKEVYQQEYRTRVREQISNELGATSMDDPRGKFSYEIPMEGGNSMEVVTIVRDADGKEYYNVGIQGTQVALKKAIGGDIVFIDKGEYDEKLASGEYQANTQLASSFLDNRVSTEKETAEKEARDNQLTEARNKIINTYKANPQIDLGTKDSPKVGTVTGFLADGVIVEFENPTEVNGVSKTVHKISYEQAGNAIGVDAVYRSEEEKAQDEADNVVRRQKEVSTYNKQFKGMEFTSDGKAYKFVRMVDAPIADENGVEMVKVSAQDGENVSEVTIPLADLKDRLDKQKTAQLNADKDKADVDASKKDDGTPKDFRGNPLPMKTNDNGELEVDTDALWNKDPEAYLRWNDSQRGGNTEDSQEMLSATIAKEQAQKDALINTKSAETVPSARQALDKQITEIDNRINLYSAILHKYQAESNFNQKNREYAIALADIKRRMLDAKTQERYDELKKAETELTQKYLSDTIDSAYNMKLASLCSDLQAELNKIADMPVAMVTYASVESTMREKGASEEAINSVLQKIAAVNRENLVSGHHYVIKGCHNNGIVYIFAEGNADIEEATKSYYHERQHEINAKEDTEVVDAVLSLAGNDANALYKTLETIIGEGAASNYKDSSARVLADEIVAFTIQEAYTNKNYIQALKDLGLTDNLINIISKEYGRQTRKEDSISERSEDRNRDEHRSGQGTAGSNKQVDGGKSTNEQLGSVRQGNPSEQKQEVVGPNAQSHFQYFNGSLLELIRVTKDNKTNGLIKKVLAPISKRLKEDLKAKGIEITGDYHHTIDNNAIRHILKQHGGKSEDKRGQIPITDTDFERLSNIVDNYDSIELGESKGTNATIIYSKTFEDGITIYVEEKRNGKKELAAVTLWKKKTPIPEIKNRGTKMALLDGNLNQPVPDTPEATPSLSISKNEEVYNRHTTEKQTTESAKESQSEPQSGTESLSRMNSSTPLADEGTKISLFDKEITPEQSSLLSQPNSDQYPTERELYEGTKISGTKQKPSLSNSSDRHLAEHQNDVPDLLPTQDSNGSNSMFSLHPTAQIKESVPLNDSNKLTNSDTQPVNLGINSSETTSEVTNPAPKKQENSALSSFASDILNDTLAQIPEDLKGRVTVSESSTGDEVEENFIQSYNIDGKPSGITRIELFDAGLNGNPTRFVIDGSDVDASKEDQDKWQNLVDEYRQEHPEVNLIDSEESGIGFRTFTDAYNLLKWVEEKNENENSFDQFVHDSSEVIPDGVKPSNIIRFAERILDKYHSYTEDYDLYNAKRTYVKIPAEKLFRSEKNWFSPKNGLVIAVNDTQRKSFYELVAHKDAQGHLKSVSIIKYHSFDNILTEEEVVAITDAMKANATIAPTVEINDANWMGSVDTPIGPVKMGENQKAKLFAKGREQHYGMLIETLSNPNIILEEKDNDQDLSHERPSSYLFVKTFKKEDGSKYIHFESVTVSREGMEISVSSHIIRENQLKNKLKRDRLLYKATALDAPANTSAEQPIIGGSLSSTDKGINNNQENKPIGIGPFGAIYDQFKGKPNEAIEFLRSKKSGEAVGALHHKDIGEIDLVWGEEGNGKSDGFGLAKLIKYHPEVLDSLQELLDTMKIVSQTDNRIQLESNTHKASIRLTWDNEKKNWLLTAYEKKNSAFDNTTDTDETLSGKRNDTATPQSTISTSKGNQTSSKSQKEQEEEKGINRIRDKWEKAQKDIGSDDIIVLPNGEEIAGAYVLTEAFAPTPSHDIEKGFTKTEGFPVDENGHTVNDRDYEHDKEAQRQVEKRASAYDQRALQTPVVVSNDGIVISGNDRTMSSQIAAKQGTDLKYKNYLLKYANKYGFTPEQVAKYNNPRVVFVPSSELPYTASTFAKFNSEEKKTLSKTESAVKYGKMLSQDTISNIAEIIDSHETIAETYADKKAVAEIIRTFVTAGVIQENEISRIMDGDSLSGTGEDIVESVLLGSLMSEEALRCVMADKAMRRSIMSAIMQIVKNNTYGDYSLNREFSAAVILLHQAKSSGLVKINESVANFMNQPVLDGFGENPIASATVQMIANTINGAKINGLKNVLSLYNKKAELAASGQANLFLGEPESKESILKEILNEYGYNTETYTNTYTRKQQSANGAEQAQKGSTGEQTSDAVSGNTRGGTEEVKSESSKKYIYRLNVRPFGVGNQPDGGRRIDDGSKFGAVAYDKPLSIADIKHYTLTAITDAKQLKGRTFSVPFGKHRLI